MKKSSDSANTNNKKAVRKGIRTAFLWAIPALLLGLSGIFLYLRGTFLPGHLIWQKDDFSFSLKSDYGPDDPLYTAKVRAKSLTIRDGDTVVYTSPGDILIQQALAADIDRDGETELLLLCWRRGNYGQAKPFWVKNNDRSFSQHLFIYDLTGNLEGKTGLSGGTAAEPSSALQPGTGGEGSFLDALFMSSDLGCAYSSLSVKEDGKVVLTEEDGTDTVWVWSDWGLQLLS